MKDIKYIIADNVRLCRKRQNLTQAELAERAELSLDSIKRIESGKRTMSLFKMNVKARRTKKQVNVENQAIMLLSKEELDRKIEVIKKELRSYTWRDLETNGKFAKNDKLSFITDDMLIAGCDIGSETHYIRAIDVRGRKLSSGAFEFSNTSEGFENAKAWMLELAAKNDKKQIVLGLEPTGHYWFALAAWMISNGISVVQVNPYAVKQSKEIEDNSQRKDDRKDPKLIANLVKDGNYGMPYLPEKVYADMRRLSMFRDQLTEDRIRNINRLHRELKIYFPEYMDAFGKIDGAFTLEVLKVSAIPSDITALGAEGIRNIWHNAKLRGRGYNRANEIVSYAEKSVGLTDGTDAGREAVKWYAEQILKLDEQLAEIELKVLYMKNAGKYLMPRTSWQSMVWEKTYWQEHWRKWETSAGLMM